MQYAHPDALVDTDWVDAHISDPTVRVVEADIDMSAYGKGHIPGALPWGWSTHLFDTVSRDIVSKDGFERLMAESGISEDTTVVLYGGHDNWFAAWAFWGMKIYGHLGVRLLNGGKNKWQTEGRPLAAEKPAAPRTSYRASHPDLSMRCFLPDVNAAMQTGASLLLDVRGRDEFMGRAFAPPGFSASSERAGHIPGARNVPWDFACNADGVFRPPAELCPLYEDHGVAPHKTVIAYCRIGARACHTWFVLRYLLGYPDVKVYDGSWAEWGNLVRAPIERGGDRR